MPVDSRELPGWTGFRLNDTLSVQAFRYLTPGVGLELVITRFDDAAVLQGLIEDLVLTTVPAEDGQSMTRLNRSIRNNNRQYLSLTLPQSGDVWSDFSDGQPVKPNCEGDPVLIPLLESGGGQEQVSVVQMIDVHLPTDDHRTVVLSRYTQPEKELQMLIQAPHLELPENQPRPESAPMANWFNNPR